MTRPPVVVRAGFGLLAFGGLLFTGALLLSDRAPRVMRVLLRGSAERLWTRIDAAGAPTAIGQEARARPDFVVHVVVWAIVTVLAALTVWSLRGLAVVMAGAFAAGLVLEFLQGRWTHSRAVETGDVVGNAAGVLAGGLAALAVMGTWAGIAHVMRTRACNPGGPVNPVTPHD